MSTTYGFGAGGAGTAPYAMTEKPFINLSFRTIQGRTHSTRGSRAFHGVRMASIPFTGINVVTFGSVLLPLGQFDITDSHSTGCTKNTYHLLQREAVLVSARSSKTLMAIIGSVILDFATTLTRQFQEVRMSLT